MGSSSSKWLAGIGVFVLVLIVASVLVAVLGDGDSIKEYAADTPEGAVQRFLQAVEDRDAEMALSYMEAEARQGCTVQEVTQMTQYFADRSDERRIEVSDKRELSDGRVLLTIRVTEVNVSPPFDISEYTFEQNYTLAQSDEAWLIEYPAWPVSYCRAAEEATRTSS